MKAATAGDKPDAFSLPKGLVAVQVCRLSGKLPASGCSDVEVVNDAGETSRRSMIYTDYFLRGQEPTEICPLHGGGSLLDKFASIFGHHDGARARDERGDRRAGAPPSRSRRAGGGRRRAAGARTAPTSRRRSAASGRVSSGRSKPKPAPSSDPNQP